MKDKNRKEDKNGKTQRMISFQITFHFSLWKRKKKIPITINSNHVKMLAIYNKNEEFVSLSLAGVGDKKKKTNKRVCTISPIGDFTLSLILKPGLMNCVSKEVNLP